MKIIDLLLKTADNKDERERTIPDMLREDYPTLLAAPAGAALGATIADDTGAPIQDKLRGALTGLSTASGGVLGGILADKLAPNNFANTLGGAGGGSLIGYLLARHALKNMHGPKEKYAEASPVLKQLLEAKRQSDLKNYPSKQQQLNALIAKHPNDFYIDSEEGNILGITHRPTGFKIHTIKNRMPTQIQKGSKSVIDGIGNLMEGVGDVT